MLKSILQHSKLKIQSTPITRTPANANCFSFTFRIRVTMRLRHLLTLPELALIKKTFRRASAVQKNEALISYTCTTGNNLQVSHYILSLFYKLQKGTLTFSRKRCNWVGYFTNLQEAHTGLYAYRPRERCLKLEYQTNLLNGTALVAGLAT